MIKPTNGRVVLFTPSVVDDDILQHDVKQPLAAHVAHVWGDRMINVMVIDSNGVPHSRTSVPLLQDDDAKPEGGYFCSWMEFQKGQAAKFDAAKAATT